MIFSNIFQKRALTIFLCLSFALMLATAVLVGAEFDEAWIVASGRQAFDDTAIPSVIPVTTTGGLHFLVIGLTQALPFSPLAVPRMLSLFSIAALYFVLLRALAPLTFSPIERRIIAVTCIAAPGTILLSGMGYGVVLATTLFLTGIFIALRSQRITVSDALMAGAFIGAALATRWTFLPALPVILLFPCFARKHLGRNILMSLALGAVAVAVFIGLLTLQTQMLDGTGPAGGVSLEKNIGSAGVGSGIPSPARMYSFLVRFMTTMPVTLIFLAGIAFLTWRDDNRTRRLILVLIGASGLITAAWIYSSPWMHLRYIWPAFLMLSICAGLCLVALHRYADSLQRNDLRLVVVAFPVLLAGIQILVAVRVIAIGAAMQINSAGYENLENHFKPFYHIQEQREIVQHLQTLEPDTIIGAIGLPGEFGSIELALLSDRHVIDYSSKASRAQQSHPDYIIAHRFSPFNQTGQEWLETLGPPVQNIKGYRLYAFPETASIPDAKDLVIDNQLYRFFLPKWASLTGF